MRARRRRDVTRLALSLVAFAVIASALGASKFQQNQGGTWLHSFLATLPITGGMAALAGVGMLSMTRPIGDGMAPEDLEVPPSPEMLTWGVRPEWPMPWWGYALGGVAGLVLVGWITVQERSPGATLFMLAWVSIMTVGFVSWQRTPSDLALHGDLLGVHQIDGGDEVISVASITEIRWPRTGGSITVSHGAGRVAIPMRTPGLEDLVLELRRRNRSIDYDGYWPPVIPAR